MSLGDDDDDVVDGDGGVDDGVDGDDGVGAGDDGNGYPGSEISSLTLPATADSCHSNTGHFTRDQRFLPLSESTFNKYFSNRVSDNN